MSLSAAASNRRLFVDLTDVVHHARHNHSVTGIQRVQLEAARALVAGGARAFFLNENLFVDLSRWLKQWSRCSTAELYLAFRDRFGHPDSPGMPDSSEDRNRRYIRAQKTIVRTRRLRHLSWSLRPLGRGAVLYVGGAFWADPGSLPFYEYAVRRGAALAVFVHDMIPVTYPQFVDGGALPAFERLLRLPFAAVANSNYTRADIGRAAAQIARALQPEPIEVVRLAQEYPGWERNGQGGAPPSPRLEQLGSARFALCVGTVEIRKNHAALLHLWASLWAEHGESLPRLVVAGRRGWMAETALHLLDAAEVGGPFLFVEAPSDAELAWLYAQCDFTVFPSMVEGWGLPVGESLWFGKPCVASSATAIPEVGGALCDYGDPYDIASFGQAIIRFGLDAHALHARSAEIRAAPLRRWREVSAEVTDTIQTLAAHVTERPNRRSARL